MIGIPSFNLSAFSAISACLGLAAVQPLAADALLLANDSRVTGTVSAILENGSVVLETPLALEPLEIRGDAVRSVSFSGEAGDFTPPSARVELTNGDVLPILLRSLDDGHLEADSPLTGPLRIPRAAIRALQLGITDSRMLYSGPDGIEGWRAEAGRAMTWGFEGGKLTIEGQGSIRRKFELPEQFIVRFTLGWNRNPQFKFTFADSLLPMGEKSNSYYITFNQAGFEIKRESSEGARFPSLATINRGPDQFPGNTVKVELRVDRKRNLIYLYLNDQFEGRYVDPSSKPPRDGGISLVSTASQGVTHEVTGIEIADWDPSGERHRTEERGDAKQDALIARDAARFGGKLLAIRPSDEGPIFAFKSDFGEEALELPESEVSTVFFAMPEADDEAEAPNKPLRLRLRGNGLIQVDSCKFSEGQAMVRHPLLGDLVLARSGIAALERAPAVNVEKDEP
jgi:hypothetical protein